MLKTTYTLARGCLACVLMIFALNSSYGQAIVQVRVTSVEVTQNEDCDGFSVCDSDFTWEFQATDNTIGKTNNNSSSNVFGLVNGRLGGDFNHAYVDNNNGPFTLVPGGPNIGGTCFLNNGDAEYIPGNGLFFNHEYPCASDVPTVMNMRWIAYDNDDLAQSYNGGLGGMDGETIIESFPIPVPAAPGTSGPITRTLNSTDGGCPQTYRITFEVITQTLAANLAEDNICNAVQIPVNNTTQQFAWCGPLTMEPNEPEFNSVTNAGHGSAWFYFVAPASGQVTIETDLGTTEFGTELALYHAADGLGCIAGFNNYIGYVGPTPIKNKFNYLSYQGDADDDIPVINPSAPATAHFADVFNVAPSIRDGHALIAGEIYYIQLTTDDANQRGYIGIKIEDRGGSPFDGVDIPCQGADISADAQSTTVRTEANGMPESVQLTTDRVSDEEIDGPFTGNNASDYVAYTYTSPSGNGLNGSMWVQFTAGASGRIYLEGDIDNAAVNESENLALYAYDPRFAPGTPTDMFCANLTQLEDVEGGTGILGANKTAIIERRCLEPGYTYYGMVDPQGVSVANDAEVWAYDPSVADPTQNPPGNDILCLTNQDSIYEVPVQLIGQPPLTFGSVAGDNENACIETLAGEPFSHPQDSNRANQTVWHYFVAPPSGVIEMRLRAYIGLDTLNYAVYELLNGDTCYGGLSPRPIAGATYTEDGTQGTQQILPIAFGSTGFGGSTVDLCCLNPGQTYVIQLDGGSPGDQGQYIIEYINEEEVYAGDSRYVTALGDTINYNSMDTAFICYNDTIIPSVMLNALGISTSKIPDCMGLGYVIHDSLPPLPDSIINGNFGFLDSVFLRPHHFVNNGNGSGALGNPQFNSVYYVTAMADRASDWGSLLCPSASIENGAPVVFLQQITTTQTYDPNNCVIGFSATGGEPAYNGSDFMWVVTNTIGDTISMGTMGNGVAQSVSVPTADVYTVEIIDNSGCGVTLTINAATCLNPCKNNPVFINPDPIDSSVYTCLPGGDSALVTILLTGGQPSATGGDYIVNVAGSTIPGQNGTYNVTDNNGAAATPFSFKVGDGDTWTVIAGDINACADTASHTFTYNLTNCPDYCAINPVVANYNYDCQPTGISIVQVTIGGGAPSNDGSNYSVSIVGSTVFGQNYSNATLPGVVGGVSTFSFIVNDGDTWQMIVTDTAMCADTLNDNYDFLTDCDPCTMLPVEILPDPITSNIYTCQTPATTATVTLYLIGGAAGANGENFQSITVTGSTVGGNGTYVQGTGAFTFNVGDGDNWQVVAVDSNFCADTATGVFNYLQDCDPCGANPVQILPDPIDSTVYTCNANGTALVTLYISGGQAGTTGNYQSIVVSGSNFPGANGTYVQGTGAFQFSVNDGDTWQVIATDSSNCVDTATATYNYNATNCNICLLDPLVVGPYTYTCNGDGSASVAVTISGGQPAYDASNYNITVTGSTASTGGNVSGATLAGVVGASVQYTFTVENGDNWNIAVTDPSNCSDNESGLYVFNSANCPNVCALANIDVTAGNYTCNIDKTANITIALSGGQPSFDGSNYLVTIIGATNNSGYQIPVAGQVNDTIDYTFQVTDGDNWVVVVSDGNCQDSTAGSFAWTPSTCGNLCNDPGYSNVTINGGTGIYTYDCDSLGNAELDITLTGGLPALTNGTADYILTVTINGNSAQYLVDANNVSGIHTIDLKDGDVWSVAATDALTCNTATLGATFNTVAAIANTDATDELLLGQNATLDGSGSIGNNLSYVWTPTTWVVDPNTASTTTQPLESTTYILEVTDNYGCSDTASVPLTVGRCVPQHAGFTPNKDGVNDTWEIPCLTLFDNEVEVYNRWGQLVFKATNYDGTWDGTNNGQNLTDGTYYYVIIVTFPQFANPITYKGTVTLIR